MHKISLLTFSRNDIDEVIGLIRDMHSYADDIVLVDSSDEKQRKELSDKKKEFKLSKLRIFYAVALGLPDPLFLYGTKKCKSEWVLLMGSDERLSIALKKELHNILNTTNANALSIKRYEGKESTFTTWQLRLYKRSKTTFKGLLHEQPDIEGTIGQLTKEKYYMKHMVESFYGDASIEYDKLEKFERYTYEMFNNKIYDYFYKINMAESDQGQHSLFKNLVLGALILYERLTLKNSYKELTNFDYRIFYWVKYRSFLQKTKNKKDREFLINEKEKRLKDIEKWKSEIDGRENLEISKIIHKIGITRFLDLDKEKTIRELNKKYKNKKQGITLLMNLLKEKYESSR